jgi:TolB-like protein/DNA-binding winged helix-turn-helix (wHTH) protein/tetratricopeptide (TPR) repeat protein
MSTQLQMSRSDIHLSGRQLELGGRTVTIGARAFDVLSVLMKNRERVVTKRELLESAWPGLVVEENNLQVQISTLRKVLGHDSITTIPGQGYQFTAPPYVERGPFQDTAAPAPQAQPEEAAAPAAAPVAAAAPPAPAVEPHAPAAQPQRLRAWLLLGVVLATIGGFGAWRTLSSHPLMQAVVPAAGGTTAVADRSVAVLPFVDMSEKKDLEYFSDGLCEELLHLLSRVPEMRVAARTSAFSFKGKSVDVPTIARTLKVANVLEGSVRRSGDHLRITAQLVRADNGFELWSQTYDRKLGDMFQIQDEIAASVVQGLHFALLGESEPKSTSKRSTAAYSLYLQARSLELRANTQADWEKVAEYARLTISTDVTFPQAWAFFSHVLSTQAQLGYIPGNIGWGAARQAAMRSLELDPTLPEGHAALAGIYIGSDWNWDAAQTQVEDALQQDSGNALAMSWGGYLALALGQNDRALSYFEGAVAADPLDPDKYNLLGQALILKGRSDEAQVALHKALLIDSGQVFSHWYLGRIALASGDPGAALAEIDHEPHEEVRLVGTAIAVYAQGRKADSDIPLRVLEQKFASANPTDIAMVYAYRGEADKAFAWLDRAYKERDPACVLVKAEPLFENIRNDPRYDAFLHRMKLPA